MSNTIMKPSDFSASKIEYTDLKAMGTTGAKKQMYLNYDGGQRLLSYTKDASSIWCWEI